MQPEQPEHPGALVGETVIGPGEHLPDIGVGVPGVRSGQASTGMRQFRGQRGQREARLGGGAGGDNAQRQGQPRALVDDLLRGLAFRRHAIRAEAAGQ